MSTSVYNRKDRASVDTLRLLAVDMVETAQSGHPGLPLGAAPLLYVLWTRFLKRDPLVPHWLNRDRFVLSPGHGSALLYALLHLCGYGLTIDDLKNFRQWGSLTPGHPEKDVTPGVEVSTGPLGHGLAMGVGLAMGERMMGTRFNKPGFPLFNHFTYGLVSDGDLMEGVAAEAASLAGVQALGKLIYLYDDNHMTIEGSTDLAFTEDVRGRFLAYGWQVIVVADGEDLLSVHLALENAQRNLEKPSLIMCRTVLGAGSPKADTPKAHGEPLGAEALAKTRQFYGYGDQAPFFVDERVAKNFHQRSQTYVPERLAWEATLAQYRIDYPEESAELNRRLAAELPELGEAKNFPQKDLSTRAASSLILNDLAQKLPELVGGSADLGPSNKTILEGLGSFLPLTPSGRNIHFGVREHAMGAIVNGLALYQGILPYGSTFLSFADFARPSLRMAALMGLKVIHIYTHDSVGVGEDGPTHQPVEQLAALRILPRVTVIRPADAYETAALWPVVLKRSGPAVFILSRQDLPVLRPDDYPAIRTGPAFGGYVLSDSEGTPEAIILATGSEVGLALAAQKLLVGQKKIRVVSLPSWELFEERDQAYRDSVLPPQIDKRLAVEAALSIGWARYLGPKGQMVSVEDYGRSAPAAKLFDALGFTPEKVAARVLGLFD
ncbi:MAG: transketolase [Deltaproteobacteria bacterium]|jgi:transketolase|nr:transketolase [Deltaproteobacteria bacterium]